MTVREKTRKFLLGSGMNIMEHPAGFEATRTERSIRFSYAYLDDSLTIFEGKSQLRAIPMKDRVFLFGVYLILRGILLLEDQYLHKKEVFTKAVMEWAGKEDQDASNI